MIKKFIKAVWVFPQNIIGFIIQKISKATPYTTYKDANVYSWKMSRGLSLGKHIFVPFEKEDPTIHRVQQYIKHEYGHTIQSKYLGWFYLFIIVIPSAIWAQFFQNYRKRTGKSYYDFYTEKSADKLGGVDR